MKTTEAQYDEQRKAVPEAWRSVVEWVIASLHLIVQYNRALFQSLAHQILSDNDNCHTSTPDILLCTGKYQTKL